MILLREDAEFYEIDSLKEALGIPVASQTSMSDISMRQPVKISNLASLCAKVREVSVGFVEVIDQWNKEMLQLEVSKKSG